ncbi:unnamed protein product [Symbiodinium sp. CCMP2456]|nr:unnamed protein product [Symbiodinium sp. CCMP2456]
MACVLQCLAACLLPAVVAVRSKADLPAAEGSPKVYRTTGLDLVKNAWPGAAFVSAEEWPKEIHDQILDDLQEHVMNSPGEHWLNLELLTPGCAKQVLGLYEDICRRCRQKNKAAGIRQGERQLRSSAWYPFTWGGNLGASEKPEFQIGLQMERQWLDALAYSEKQAILWAGFWEGESSGRTTKEALFQFADLLDRQTVHPGTELGQLVEKHDGLDQCSYQRTHERELLQNFWTWASASFVRGMVRHGQESIVAFVNKDVEGPRALSKSVLAQCEIPSIGQMSLFAGWTPHVVLVDLKGTCNITSPFLQRRLVSQSMLGFRSKSSVVRTIGGIQWSCVDCSESDGCTLDASLAEFLKAELAGH